MGRGYGAIRRADPRVAEPIWQALGDARTVVNVGAGAGSYEPTDREVVAVRRRNDVNEDLPMGDEYNRMIASYLEA